MSKFEKPQSEEQKEEFIPLVLSSSPEGLGAVNIRNPSEKVQKIIRGIISANHFDDPAYHARGKVGAYLQADYPEWMMVEFWKGKPEDHQEFIDFMNKEIQERLAQE